MYRREAGLTLIELVMFIVVVGLGVAGILLVMNFTTVHSTDPLPRKQGLAIAESMLEEVQLKDYSPPAGGYTPPTCPASPPQSDRKLFDDIGDYACFSTTGIFAIDGTTPISGLENYSVSVTVADADLGTITQGSSNAKLITVTVTEPGGDTLTLAGYRTNY